MEEKKKYTKEKYRSEIAKKGKSIPDIALELGKTPAAIRKEIRSLYTYRARADQLIGIADANEAAQKLRVNAPVTPVGEKKSHKSNKGKNVEVKGPYALRLAVDKGIGIIDTSYVMDFYDECKKIEHIIVPRFCLNEMRKIAEHKPAKEKAAINRKIKYLEKHAEVIFVEKLPMLDAAAWEHDFKPRSFNFARYVQHVWYSRGTKVPYLTRAYEANTLISKYVSLKKTGK